ncbi:hypothetical protein LIT25_17720 [Bacillus sp. F19]|nr:hypothetical protein LIT25_17720 [Bacillus sp. F19]
MNEKLMNVLTRSIIAGLPPKKKNLYQYIESLEDRLASQCETKEQFLNLLIQRSPFQQAAVHFCMTVDETYRLMKQIENEINRELDKKIDKHRGIDYTEKVMKNQGNTHQDKKYYLLVN